MRHLHYGVSLLPSLTLCENRLHTSRFPVFPLGASSIPGDRNAVPCLSGIFRKQHQEGCSAPSTLQRFWSLRTADRILIAWFPTSLVSEQQQGQG